MAVLNANLAEQGQRVAIRLLTKAGSLPLLDRPEVRHTVGRLLTGGAHRTFEAQRVVGRAFAKKPGAGDPTRPAPAERRGRFDLTPTEDQEMLRSAAAEIADEVIRPAGAQADADRAVPAEVKEALAEMGLALVGVPVELEGIAEERSAVTAALVMMELARGDMGIAVSTMATASVATALANYGSAAQQATYLPAFTGARGAEAITAAALAIMEPPPLFDPLAPETSGITRGDGIVLNGTKALVPNAEAADLFIVSATVDGTPRLVLLERATPGITIEDDPAMGVRAARTGRLVLADVTVSADALLGSAADHVDAVRRARLAWAAMAVGTAQAVRDQVIPYVKERKAFGEPIAHRQAVAFAISNIAIEGDGLRLVVLRAAARLDAGKDASREIALARRLAATYAAQIGSDAVQLLGGHGFVKDWDNERWYRDLRGAGLYEGALLL